MTASGSGEHIEVILKNWLAWLGLQFDPFLPLDAAADPHLSRYMIHHEAFLAVWGDWISCVFAPPGGGKTALRLRTVEACYIGQETNRPFPVPYVPPLLLWGGQLPSLDDHLAALARAGAGQLLLSLAHRPHWFFRLNQTARQRVRHVLDWNLPGPLSRYLDLCRAARHVAPLCERFGFTLVIPDPPDETTLLHFCAALEAMPCGRDSLPTPAERWQALLEVLLTDLHFDAVYVLLDGLDAAPETAHDSACLVSVLAPLLDQALDWCTHNVFLKGFLPLQVRQILLTRWPILSEAAHFATMEWTPELLVELVRQRIFVASGGAFDSLNAIASPAVGDLEKELASVVIPLPREMLVLTRRVLWEHVCEWGPEDRLHPRDVSAALAWYREHHVHGILD